MIPGSTLQASQYPVSKLLFFVFKWWKMGSFWRFRPLIKKDETKKLCDIFLCNMYQRHNLQSIMGTLRKYKLLSEISVNPVYQNYYSQSPNISPVTKSRCSRILFQLLDEKSDTYTFYLVFSFPDNRVVKEREKVTFTHATNVSSSIQSLLLT